MTMFLARLAGSDELPCEQVANDLLGRSGRSTDDDSNPAAIEICRSAGSHTACDH
jgi:hypothetical protein